MVTHDLRMCRYVDRVIRMMDGTIRDILSTRAEIDRLIDESPNTENEILEPQIYT